MSYKEKVPSICCLSPQWSSVLARHQGAWIFHASLIIFRTVSSQNPPRGRVLKNQIFIPKEQLWAHKKFKKSTKFLHTLPPPPNLPLLFIAYVSVATLSQLTSQCWYIIITEVHSTCFTLCCTVFSFDKCKIPCIHHYNIIHNGFTVLKKALCITFTISPSPNPPFVVQ